MFVVQRGTNSRLIQYMILTQHSQYIYYYNSQSGSKQTTETKDKANNTAAILLPYHFWLLNINYEYLTLPLQSFLDKKDNIMTAKHLTKLGF